MRRLAVGLGVWLSTWWLLAQTHGLHGAAEAAARMDAIKTGLSVGAGIGGAVAVTLALRRQWLAERDQAHREDVDYNAQRHSERVAAASERDAVERRVADLYVRAVEQLGSQKSVVRLGAMHALERLGQNNPDLRQTVCDVICAYLRMPYTPPALDPGAAGRRQVGDVEELLVRKTGQDVLAEHLRDEDYLNQRADESVPDSFWPQVKIIDLTGAQLVDFNLSHCRIDTVEFNHTVFSGESLFRSLSCDLAFFQSAVFYGHTDFRGAVFANSVWFSNGTFRADVWFKKDQFYPGASFGRHAAFKYVTFGGKADFTGAVFSGSAEFAETIYDEGANAIIMTGALAESPDAVSPEITQAPSSWPPGWTVHATQGSAATLIRRAHRKTRPVRSQPSATT